MINGSLRIGRKRYGQSLLIDSCGFAVSGVALSDIICDAPASHVLRITGNNAGVGDARTDIVVDFFDYP